MTRPDDDGPGRPGAGLPARAEPDGVLAARREPDGAVPDGAYAAALAGLPGIGPAGLAGLLRRHDPPSAWAAVLAGDERRPGPMPSRSQPAMAPEAPGLPAMAPDVSGLAAAAPGRPSRPSRSWVDAARRVDVAAGWADLVARGIGVSYLGGPGYPGGLRLDPEPPGVLFWLGRLARLEQRCVGVIGTRRCTHYGREVAFDLGRDLARAGICVVSGLALGIDGAAHSGALEGAEGGTVGVAASGVDVVYPRAHAELWSRVAAAGAVVSETAPGQPAQAWRFPARNRIIAGLVSAVVVVESQAGGGSMLTVSAALARGVEVLVVPGPVHSAASAGTNQLLMDGARPVRHAGDVLDALGDVRPWPPDPQLSLLAPAADGDGEPAAGPGPMESGPPGRQDATGPILDAVDWTPTSPGVIAERTGMAIVPLSAALHRLERLGLIRQHAGRWERVRSR